MLIHGIYSAYPSEKQHDDNIWETEASANQFEGDWTHLLTSKPNWANGISALPAVTVSETTAVDASRCRRISIERSF